MAISLLALLLFAIVASCVAAAGRFVRRPLRRFEASAFFLLTVLFLFPGFFRGKTILPVDHAMLLSPWGHTAAVARYNVNLNDAVTQNVPWAKAVRMAWKEGSLPLRDRWNGGGMVLAANGQSAAFSPFSFLMLPLPLWAAFNLLVATKIFLAFAGMSLWLRELRLSSGAAAFGAVLFALSFSMAPWLLFPISAVACLLPWVLFAVERTRDAGSRSRAMVLLTAVFFAWPLCGHPESTVLCALFVAIWLAVRTAAGDLSDAPAVAARIALAGAIALALSAFLTVPEAIAVVASDRIPFAEGFRRGLPSSLSPHRPFFPTGFLTVLFPRALGDAIDSPMLAVAPAAFPEVTHGFFGVVGACVALLVFRPGSRRRRAGLALLVPLILALSVCTGTWPFYDLALRMPVLRLVFLFRYGGWISFAGSAIAAFEVDRLFRDTAQKPKAALAGLIPAGLLAALALLADRLLASHHARAGGVASQQEALAWTLAALFAVALISLTGFAKPGAARALPLLFAAAAAAELFAQDARLYRFGPPQWLFPETPLTAFLRSRPGPFRVGGDGAMLFPNSNIFAGVEDIRTHDPVERRDYVELLDRAAGYSPADYFKRIRNWNAPELDLLNLRYLAAEPGESFPAPKWRRVYAGADGVVFENQTALPRVFGKARIPSASRRAPDGFEISGYRETTNSIHFRALVPTGGGPADAIVSVVQDGGWSARSESGRTIPTEKASGVLLALALPAGDHTIHLRYRPPGFAAGSLISIVSVGGVLAWALAHAYAYGRRRRSRPPTGFSREAERPPA